MKNFESLRVPKYVQLMLRLRDQIENGSLKHGDPLPTREKLMKEYELSLSTVTRAISELERQGWLISRQGSGTFVVKRTETSDEGVSEGTTVGLLVPINRSDIQPFVLEFVHESIEQNINVVVMYAPEDEEYELNQAKLLLEKEVKALVWFPIEPKRHVSVASLFRKNQIPVIICEKVTDKFEPPWICVRNDYYGGTKSALQHFLDQGHKRIAYIGPKGGESGFGPIIERWNAYKDTMKEHNLWNPEELVFTPSLFKDLTVHAQRLESIFNRPKSPTAIIAYDDTTALDAAHGLKSIGLRVPEDIAIIGHGDFSSGRYCTPRLSTVSNSWSEYVDCLMRLLMTKESNDNNQETAQNECEIVIQQRLLIRESTTQSTDEMMAAS